MNLVPFGKTGLQVTPIGLGMAVVILGAVHSISIASTRLSNPASTAGSTVHARRVHSAPGLTRT